MPTIDIRDSVSINLGHEEIWRVVADDFGEIARWSQGATASMPIPTHPNQSAQAAPFAGRSCEVPGFGTTTELLTDYDPERGVIHYSIASDKIPGFMTGAHAGFELERLGAESTRVTSIMGADVSGPVGTIMAPLMRRRIAKGTRQMLQDLKWYCETGTVTAGKDAQIRKAAR